MHLRLSASPVHALYKPAMPSLRGINVSVAVQPGPERLPEFPHPDASSVRILPVQHSPGFPGPQSRRASASPGSSSSSRIHKTNPTVSVYIPSIPGAQFCIRYAVTRPPEPHCHVFFKVLMNGRSVTSWGIDPAVHSSGSVMRALYEPCDKWHYKEAGVVLKRQGIESRCFYFTSTPAAVPVADDGGLIEVHVFRAKGRRPRAPLLSNFRGQEQYGIAYVTSFSPWSLPCP